MAARIEQVDPTVIKITGQYRAVTGACDLFFSALRVRTDGELWRLPTYKGIGSCIINRDESEAYIEGPAREHLIFLRDQRNMQVSGQQWIRCPYHRKDTGCILGDLKSPPCISEIDNIGELNERFDLNANALRLTIFKTLQIILGAKTNNQYLLPLDPSVNDELVGEFVEEMNMLRAYVESFPILRSQELKEEVVYTNKHES